MDNRTVYLNGQYIPLNEAKISVLDRGFLFGDGVYEVIPSYSGNLFHLQQHIKRLHSSLNNIRLHNPYSEEQWLEILTPLLDKDLDQYIYLQITRGIAPKRDHAFPEDIQPTVFAMCSNIVPMQDKELGVKAITLDDSRWELCNIKATTLLANILHRQSAVDQGCAEAILIKDGYVTEGAASNIFAVLDDTLITPPNGETILPGITRQIILDIAAQNNIPVSEEIFSLDALKTASEIWLTSSTREIVPVINLDGQIIGNGKPGPLWHTVNQLFQDQKNSKL